MRNQSIQKPRPAHRREYKYLVEETTAAAIHSFIQPLCKPDPHGGDSSGSYPVRSLYLDTWNHAFARANAIDRPDRFKLRIRSYPDDPKAPVFAEVKRRIGDVYLKSRARLADDWPDSLLGQPSPQKQSHPGPGGSSLGDFLTDEALEDFRLLTTANDARPAMLVDYQRQAYIAHGGLYTRVNFDRRLRCQRTDRLSLEEDPLRWRSVDSDEAAELEQAVVLEIKFGTSVPNWLREMVQRFDLMRTSYSKYCFAMRVWEPGLGQPIRNRRELG